MKKEKIKIGDLPRSQGMTVPDGYFADFAARMAQSLEKTEFEESASQAAVVKPRTFWQRIRPYAYMAAMFAGVWCMMKMFTLITATPTSPVPSETLSQALSNDAFVNEYIISDVSQYDIMSQMMDEGFDLDMLNQDFDEDFTADEDSDYYQTTDMEIGNE